jgi:hypothetical protein
MLIAVGGADRTSAMRTPRCLSLYADVWVTGV